MGSSTQEYSIFTDTMANMTFPEIVQAAADNAIVLWGMGVIEEHGPHLPLATDVYLPSVTLRKVRVSLKEKNIPSVIMPPFYWGVNHITGLFPGSFEVRPEIMVELLVDIIKSLKKDGFRRLFCISGHGDTPHNLAIIKGLERGELEANVETVFVGATSFFKRIGANLDDRHILATATEFNHAPKYFDIHAGESETSAMLGFYPDLVRTEILPDLEPTNFVIDDMVEWRKGREHTLRKTPEGYIGDPGSASADYGIKIVTETAELIANAIASRVRQGSHERRVLD